MCNAQTLHTGMRLDGVYLLVYTTFTFILYTDMYYFIFVCMKCITTNDRILDYSTNMMVYTLIYNIISIKN
jgi:hypothetical protein